MAQPQHACIVSSYVDGVSNSHTARKLELARSYGGPFAAWCASAQRMSADNGERTAASIRCEPSDGLVRNLLRAPIAGDCEQPIAPRCHKYRRFRHGLPSLSQLSRVISVTAQGHAFCLGTSQCVPANMHAYKLFSRKKRFAERNLLRGQDLNCCLQCTH
jgi:hypothetical protein